MSPPFLLLAILLLAFSSPSSSQTSLPSEAARVVERRANGFGVRDSSQPRYLQPLSGGRVRLGGRAENSSLSIHDLAADGTQLRSLRLNFTGLEGLDGDLAPDGAGGTFAFGQTQEGCRIVRINADGNVLFQREVAMPSRADARRGGALCQGFAVLADGTSVIGEFDSPVVLVSPDGASQVQAELAVPPGVNAFIGGMASNGRDVVLRGSSDTPAVPGARFWIGGFHRNGALRWQRTFDLPERIETARIVADGENIVAAVKTDSIAQIPAYYRFLAVDGDGAPVLAPTEPFEQPSSSSFQQLLARDGRIGALISRAGGWRLAARSPDGSQRLLAADYAFDFGPNGTFWLGGLSGCTNLNSECQGHIEQRDAQGQLLRRITLPDAFEVTGVLERDGRVVVGGSDRRFHPFFGTTQRGKGYAAVVDGDQVSERDLLGEGSVDGFTVLGVGDAAYLRTYEPLRSTLTHYDGRGQSRWEREVAANELLAAAGEHGAWLLVSEIGSLKLRHVDAGGALGPVSSHALSFSDAQWQARTATDGSLWVLLQKANADNVQAQLLHVAKDGTLLSSRDSTISPRPAGFELALLDGAGDTLLRSSQSLQRFDGAGRLLHSSPGVPSSAQHANTSNRALLLHSEGAGTVQRIERNGELRWSVPAPVPAFTNRCGWWDDASELNIRVFVVFECFQPNGAALQIERWDVATGTLVRRTNLPWDFERFGAVNVFEPLLRDSTGDLLLPTQRFSEGTVALLRFQADQPAVHLQLPSHVLSSVPHSRVTRAGDVLSLVAPRAVIGDVGIVSSSSGLHGNGFE